MSMKVEGQFDTAILPDMARAGPVPDNQGSKSIQDLAHAIKVEAGGDPAIQSQLRRAAEPRLTPVEQGQLAAELDGDVGVFIPTAQSRDTKPHVDALKAEGVITEQDIAWAEKQALSGVWSGTAGTSHTTRDALDSRFLDYFNIRAQIRLEQGEVQVGDNARLLQPQEISVIRHAYGNSVNLDNVKIVRGDGGNLVAAGAFKNGHPAITIGDTIYLKVGQANLATSPEGVRTLVHEVSHVQQYQQTGILGVWTRVALEARGGADDAYNYPSRDLPFAKEALEAQSAIRGDYAAYRMGGDLPTYMVDGKPHKVSAQELEREAAGSGIFGR